MSEPKASTRSLKGNFYTILFMVVLSFICAVILSVLASALKEPQELAKELDRSKQMLIAARIMSPYGYFILQGKDGKYGPAIASENGILQSSDRIEIPGREKILKVYQQRIFPFLVNERGELFTFQQAGVDQQKYLLDYRKSGYYREPYKLIYKINPNNAKQNGEQQAEGYVIPVNGMGLWDAIYGYLALQPDGNKVIGISWYDQKETPGLGANISEPQWQSQFPGKHVFQETSTGQTDFKTAPLGITVLKGKVSEILGQSPKALSAVDGMAGATLTGNGVTNSYRDVLAAYRPFLIKLSESSKQNKGNS